jgi:hypothetical protein
MVSRLADRLKAARQRRFVGRVTERSVFESALTAGELPFCVIHVFGPGGVGKTTLLGEFAALARQAGIEPVQLDGRDIEPLPESFLAALGRALGLADGESPTDALAARGGRQVILVDTYETLTTLDGWLRDVFVPSLPDDTLVVFAGRRQPATPWRADPGWQSLVRILPLRNLSPDESRQYLSGRQIPAERVNAVLDFTHGHPLALSLVAEVMAQRGDLQFAPEAAPDVVKTLLDRFLDQSPDAQHRRAIEVCAMLRGTTERLLALCLGVDDAHELFEWLRGLSFIESGSAGIFPHDLARDAISADLRWRDPDWYAELHDRARAYYMARVQQARGLEQQSVLFDYIFLHRSSPVVRPFYAWDEPGAVLTDALRPGDVPALVAMTERWEGSEAARLAERWLAAYPESTLVFRDGTAEPSGFLLSLPLHELRESEAADDPAVAAAYRALTRLTALRPGEVATLFRFWMARETYQSVSPTQSVAFVNAVRHYLATPGLAFTCLPVADPDFWAPVFAYADLTRMDEAEFELGGRRYGMYGRDWRAMPPVAWLAVLAEREMAGIGPSATPPAPPPAPVVVLSEPEFVAAVRGALRDLLRPEALARNPLCRSRVVVDRVGPAAAAGERAAALQALLREMITTLEAAPRDAKLARALDATYVHPAPTQEAAAERLDVPFSTYRRHLTTGTNRVVASLWQQELQGVER